MNLNNSPFNYERMTGISTGSVAYSIMYTNCMPLNALNIPMDKLSLQDSKVSLCFEQLDIYTSKTIYQAASP